MIGIVHLHGELAETLPKSREEHVTRLLAAVKAHGCDCLPVIPVPEDLFDDEGNFNLDVEMDVYHQRHCTLYRMTTGRGDN